MTAPVGYGKDAPLPQPADETDRSAFAFRALARASGINPILFCACDYRVDSAIDATTASCSPVDPNLGLPGGIAIKLTPSILGEQIAPTPGQRVVVMFLDANPGKPIAIAGDPDATPVSAKVLGGGSAVARQNDAVGFLIPGSGGANWSPTNPGGGIPMHITSGSTKLESG